MTIEHAAWVVTGPTSGLGYRTALELAHRGTVVLVGHNPDKLSSVQHDIESNGGVAVPVMADFSDIVSAQHAAEEIAALGLPIRGVLNNAGISISKPAVSAQGWELAFATNLLGPLAFTDALIPALADGTTVLFVTSAVEDPERTLAVRAGFRGSRFTTAGSAARGEYPAGGSTHAGMDAYATSKQGSLAAALVMAKETPRLRFRAIEPGVNPGSNLGSDVPPAVHAVARAISPALALLPHFTTPKRAAKMIARILTDPSGSTGIYYDENGHPMTGSKQIREPGYAERYISESRQLIRSAAD